MNHVAILGAGQAGSSLAAKLRSLGFGGRITLIGEENTLPYQRPPLSKKYLMKEMTLEQLHLRPERFYADNDIALHLGRKVDAIDRAARQIRCGEDVLSYDQLALTTGATPRPLPAALGGGLPGVYVVRNLADVDRMAPEFREGRRVLVVGGGYIGLEAAAVAAKLGLKVTLIEAAERILQRVAASATSDYFRNLHAGNGVEILEGAGLAGLEREEAISVALSDGSRREVDFVIVGIGVTANDGLAAAAGLACDGGILVDARGRTSDPAIWAAGDCARLPYRGQMIRLESVQNAIDQAEAIAANMLGAEADYVPRPWFWSDQYDVKLQIAGLNSEFDRVVVRPGASEKTRSHWYFREGALLAVDAMSEPRSYMVGKRLIEAGRSPLPEQVADAGFDLKCLI
ncbi:FAD-dependent oxidoreductase [Shinella sp.]|uniref:NAD(P)/FAD-dependent oxidoreductase n=1 Tax=Shinella sp. TaxID=1870904 RepID=UPI002582D244|nr:FAD-dependent oxidoreductase [Shinella sp.]MCW5706672.1 FAD-dependent oxidoreductase [Shinella sp.]